MEKSMKHSWTTGICFGLTSATITTLGLMVGLHSFSGEKLVILGGILTIAIADAFSDALGIHISEEAENVHTSKEIWTSTFATFIAKFFFALTFAVPVLLMDLSTAIYVGIAWGLLILTLLSYIMAKAQGEKPIKSIGEHLFIAILVIIATHYVGDFIGEFFA